MFFILAFLIFSLSYSANKHLLSVSTKKSQLHHGNERPNEKDCRISQFMFLWFRWKGNKKMWERNIQQISVKARIYVRKESVYTLNWISVIYCKTYYIYIYIYMYVRIRYPDEPLRRNYSRLVPDSLSNYRYCFALLSIEQFLHCSLAALKVFFSFD